MLKKALLLLMCINLFGFDAMYGCTCDSQYNELSTAGKIFVGVVVATGAVLAAPYVLPATAMAGIASAAAATKAAVCAGAAKAAGYAASASTVSKVGWGLSAVQYTRPYILETTEEARDQLLKEKQRKKWSAREDFITCLKQNKFGSPRNAAGRPSACEDLALAYAFATSIHNLNRRTEEFKEGKCFCAVYK